MATSYPGAIDSAPTIPGFLAGPPSHTDVHDDEWAAIVALETELGTNGRHRIMKSYSGTATRDVANPSPSEGHICHLEASDAFCVYSGGAWWNYHRNTAVLQTGTTNGSGQVAVTFPQAFTSAPIVVASRRATGNKNVVVSAVTTTGFTATFYDDASTLETSTAITFDYIAMET